MSTTVQNIIDAAAERSNLNDIDLIAADEQIRFVSLAEQAVFLIAARENPDFFGREGNTTIRASSTASWLTTGAPGNIAAISKIEINSITGTVSGLAVGDEVNLISIRYPELALAPRVYMRNKTIYEYNNELNSGVSNYVTRLKLYYSYLPPVRTDASTALDLPDEWANLVILPLARIMALRDQRPDELAGIDQEFIFTLTNFISNVSVFDEATVRPLAAVQASAAAARAAFPGMAGQAG